jgi:hypothetical protein
MYIYIYIYMYVYDICVYRSNWWWVRTAETGCLAFPKTVKEAQRQATGLSLLFHGWNILVIYYWAVLLYLYPLLFLC